MHLVTEVERVRDSRREGVAHAAVAPLLAQADAEDLFLFLKKSYPTEFKNITGTCKSCCSGGRA